MTFSISGFEADAVKAYLAKAGINVSTSKPSSTLLDATARQLPAVVRASPHYYNDETEILCTAALLRELVIRTFSSS